MGKTFRKESCHELIMPKVKMNVNKIVSRPNSVKNARLQFHNDAGGTKTFPPTHSWASVVVYILYASMLKIGLLCCNHT